MNDSMRTEECFRENPDEDKNVSGIRSMHMIGMFSPH